MTNMPVSTRPPSVTSSSSDSNPTPQIDLSKNLGFKIGIYKNNKFECKYKLNQRKMLLRSIYLVDAFSRISQNTPELRGNLKEFLKKQLANDFDTAKLDDFINFLVDGLISEATSGERVIGLTRSEVLSRQTSVSPQPSNCSDHSPLANKGSSLSPGNAALMPGSESLSSQRQVPTHPYSPPTHHKLSKLIIVIIYTEFEDLMFAQFSEKLLPKDFYNHLSQAMSCIDTGDISLKMLEITWKYLCASTDLMEVGVFNDGPLLMREPVPHELGGDVDSSPSTSNSILQPKTQQEVYAIIYQADILLLSLDINIPDRIKSNPEDNATFIATIVNSCNSLKDMKEIVDLLDDKNTIVIFVLYNYLSGSSSLNSGNYFVKIDKCGVIFNSKCIIIENSIDRKPDSFMINMTTPMASPMPLPKKIKKILLKRQQNTPDPKLKMLLELSPPVYDIESIDTTFVPLQVYIKRKAIKLNNEVFYIAEYVGDSLSDTIINIRTFLNNEGEQGCKKKELINLLFSAILECFKSTETTTFLPENIYVTFLAADGSVTDKLDNVESVTVKYLSGNPETRFIDPLLNLSRIMDDNNYKLMQEYVNQLELCVEDPKKYNKDRLVELRSKFGGIDPKFDECLVDFHKTFDQTMSGFVKVLETGATVSEEAKNKLSRQISLLKDKVQNIFDVKGRILKDLYRDQDKTKIIGLLITCDELLDCYLRNTDNNLRDRFLYSPLNQSSSIAGSSLSTEIFTNSQLMERKEDLAFQCIIKVIYCMVNTSIIAKVKEDAYLLVSQEAIVQFEKVFSEVKVEEMTEEKEKDVESLKKIELGCKKAQESLSSARLTRESLTRERDAKLLTELKQMESEESAKRREIVREQSKEHIKRIRNLRTEIPDKWNTSTPAWILILKISLNEFGGMYECAELNEANIGVFIKKIQDITSGISSVEIICGLQFIINNTKDKVLEENFVGGILFIQECLNHIVDHGKTRFLNLDYIIKNESVINFSPLIKANLIIHQTVFLQSTIDLEGLNMDGIAEIGLFEEFPAHFGDCADIIFDYVDDIQQKKGNYKFYVKSPEKIDVYPNEILFFAFTSHLNDISFFPCLVDKILNFGKSLNEYDFFTVIDRIVTNEESLKGLFPPEHLTLVYRLSYIEAHISSILSNVHKILTLDPTMIIDTREIAPNSSCSASFQRFMQIMALGYLVNTESLPISLYELTRTFFAEDKSFELTNEAKTIFNKLGLRVDNKLLENMLNCFLMNRKNHVSKTRIKGIQIEHLKSLERDFSRDCVAKVVVKGTTYSLDSCFLKDKSWNSSTPVEHEFLPDVFRILIIQDYQMMGYFCFPLDVLTKKDPPAKDVSREYTFNAIEDGNIKINEVLYIKFGGYIFTLKSILAFDLTRVGQISEKMINRDPVKLPLALTSVSDLSLSSVTMDLKPHDYFHPLGLFTLLDTNLDSYSELALAIEIVLTFEVLEQHREAIKYITESEEDIKKKRNETPYVLKNIIDQLDENSRNVLVHIMNLISKNLIDQLDGESRDTAMRKLNYSIKHIKVNPSKLEGIKIYDDAILSRRVVYFTALKIAVALRLPPTPEAVKIPVKESEAIVIISYLNLMKEKILIKGDSYSTLPRELILYHLNNGDDELKRVIVRCLLINELIPSSGIKNIDKELRKDTFGIIIKDLRHLQLECLESTPKSEKDYEILRKRAGIRVRYYEYTQSNQEQLARWKGLAQKLENSDKSSLSEEEIKSLNDGPIIGLSDHNSEVSLDINQIPQTWEGLQIYKEVVLAEALDRFRDSTTHFIRLKMIEEAIHEITEEEFKALPPTGFEPQFNMLVEKHVISILERLITSDDTELNKEIFDFRRNKNQPISSLSNDEKQENLGLRLQAFIAGVQNLSSTFSLYDGNISVKSTSGIKITIKDDSLLFNCSGPIVPLNWMNKTDPFYARLMYIHSCFSENYTLIGEYTLELNCNLKEFIESLRKAIDGTAAVKLPFKPLVHLHGIEWQPC